jgi:hypothetical protein
MKRFHRPPRKHSQRTRLRAPKAPAAPVFPVVDAGLSLADEPQRIGQR